MTHEFSEYVSSHYGISFWNMIDRIETTAFNVLEDTDLKVIASAIQQFYMRKGAIAVISLFGFIRYISTSNKTHQQKKAYLSQCIAHDLSGCNDRLMQPRSSGYLLYAAI